MNTMFTAMKKQVSAMIAMLRVDSRPVATTTPESKTRPRQIK